MCAEPSTHCQGFHLMTQAEERTGLTELREARGGWATDHGAIAMPKKTSRGRLLPGDFQPLSARPPVRTLFFRAIERVAPEVLQFLRDHVLPLFRKLVKEVGGPPSVNDPDLKLAIFLWAAGYCLLPPDSTPLPEEGPGERERGNLAALF